MRPILPLLLLAGLAPPAAAISVDEIRELLLAGVDEDTLREQVLAEVASFRLEADDLLALHRAGASAGFLQFLIRRRPEAPDAEAAPTGTAENPEPAGTPAGEAGRLRREVRGDGRTVVVLTNLDAAGNPLPDSPGEPDWIRITAREEEAEGAPATRESAGAAAPLVQVVVNPPPESPLPAVPYPLFSPYPLVLTGGIAGAFDFPDRLPFLGYTADNEFPKTFTGMGMPLFNDQRPKAKEKQN
ncbi:MAG: hypothetical protein HY509_03500 [Acidobacteria bacterium]|nr:hypothetical protein [Acidobacteriota bacterium]